MYMLSTLLACAALTAAPQGHATKAFPKGVAADQSAGAPVALLPRAITSFGAATADGWIYVLGGYFGKPHHYKSKYQSDEFYRLNALDLSTVEFLANDESLQSATLEPHRGSLVRVGGMQIDDDEAEPLRSVASCRRFDPLTNRWTDLPDMPGARSSHDSVVIGDTLYVVGGWRLDYDEDPHWYDEAWSLDLATEGAEWQSIPQPFRARALAVAAVRSNLVVIGGIDGDRKVTAAVHVLDLVTGEWTSAPALPDPAFGPAALGVDGRIETSSLNGERYSWAPGELEWKRAGQLCFPRFFHEFVAAPDGGYFAIGGIDGTCRIRQIERLGAHRPGPAVVAQWTVPCPADFKNRQGMLLHGKQLYLFGGNRSTEQHDFEQEDFTNQSWSIDLSTLMFHREADFPEAIQTIQTEFSAGGGGLAVGGFGHDGEVARARTASYSIDFESGEWSDASLDLPIARSQFGLARNGEDYWVFGGLDYDPRREAGDQFRHLTTVLRSSVTPEGEARFIEAGIELPEPRRAFAGAYLNGRYYLIGGMREDFQLVEPCRAFDFASETWIDVPAPARQRLSGELVALNDRLYLIGGSSPKSSGKGLESNYSIEVFDPVANSWSLLQSEVPFPPKHIRAFAFRGRLLLASTNFDGANQLRLALIDPIIAASADLR